MEELGFENIMSDYDIENLFDGSYDSDDRVFQEKENKVEDAQTETSIDVNPDELFDGLQESVDDGDDDTKTGEGTDPSSSPNFYSSILDALYNDGSLPELSEDQINNVKSDEDFRDTFEDIINKRLDARTRRIELAMNAGADIEQIKSYENILNNLSGVTDDVLSQEGRQGEEIRRKIIAQDLANRGFSRERIVKELKKTFDAGTDVEDAKEALAANIQHYTTLYNNLIQQGAENEQRYKEATRKQGEQLRKSIIEDNKIFDEIGVDKKTRQQIYDTVSKPKYQDNNGNWLTELQNYQINNPIEFLKYVSTFYAMTDGFKNLGKLINKSVQKEKKSFVKDLEKKLTNVNRAQTGKLNYIGHGDPESEYLENFTLDI